MKVIIIGKTGRLLLTKKNRINFRIGSIDAHADIHLNFYVANAKEVTDVFRTTDNTRYISSLSNYRLSQEEIQIIIEDRKEFIAYKVSIKDLSFLYSFQGQIEINVTCLLKDAARVPRLKAILLYGE